jgi:hypothetical protein
MELKSHICSPYAEPDMVSLEVGPRQTKYLVHRPLLLQSVGLEAKLTAEERSDTISLPELDENAAHILVHYLYTKEYESLGQHELVNENALSEYKYSACVYCAATRYNIPGLAELAKEKIISFSEDLTIFDILSVAREDAFPWLLDEELWFPEHIEKSIKGAVSQDPDLFTRPEFVNQIQGDFKYRQSVMRAIVSTYSQKLVVLSEQHTGLSTPVADLALVEPSLADVSEPKVLDLDLDPIEPVEIDNEEHQVADTEPAEEAETVPDDIVPAKIEPETIKPATIEPETIEPEVTELETIKPATFESENVEPENIEPQTETPEAPESFTDEVGFGSSKTYQRLGKKTEDADPEFITDSEAPIPTHKRSDSVVQAMEDASTDSLPDLEEKAASPEHIHAAPVVVDEVSTDVKAPKKKNRNRKKKSPAATVTITDS